MQACPRSRKLTKTNCKSSVQLLERTYLLAFAFEPQRLDDFEADHMTRPPRGQKSKFLRRADPIDIAS